MPVPETDLDSGAEQTGEQIRAFLAIPLPVTKELQPVFQRISRLGTALRGVKADQFHLTVKFLGDTPREKVPLILEIVHRVAGRHKSSRASFRGLGVFPHASRPTILWAGIQPQDAIIAISRDLETELAPLGFPPETRPYSPHATLARVKARPPMAFHELIRDHRDTSLGELRVERIVLLQSSLQPEGPIYSVLGESLLLA